MFMKEQLVKVSGNREFRRCPACKAMKSTSDFYPRKGKAAGYCKDCTKAKALEWQHDQREKVVGIEVARRSRERAALMRQVSLRDKELQVVGKTVKTCRKCLLVKDLKEFYSLGESYCIPCRLEHDRTRNASSVRARLVSLLGAARTRARNNGWGFDLTIEFLLERWARQNGLCWYTQARMTWDGSRAYTAVSVDRVNSEKGYTQDNVVLCSRRVNEMKSDMSVDDFGKMCATIASRILKQEVAHG